jgi:hypothetical protein
MSDPETTATGVELLLQDPEIVAWLDDYRWPDAGEAEEDEPPRAA